MHTRALGLALLAALAMACAGNASREAIESLQSGTFSPKYHSGFWAGEANGETALWKDARQLCRVQEARPAPNCRVVFAIDLTVQIIAVHQDEDLGERLRAWIRGGTRELGLATPGRMPSPTKGFGPESPKMPPSAGK